MNTKLAAHLDEILDWEEEALDDADVAIVAYGGTARAAAHAVSLARARGVRAGLFKPRTLWPFPEEAVRALSRRVQRIVVAEMNMGQIRLEVERLAAGRVPVQGVHRADGLGILPAQIVEAAMAPLGRAA